MVSTFSKGKKKKKKKDKKNDLHMVNEIILWKYSHGSNYGP